MKKLTVVLLALTALVGYADWRGFDEKSHIANAKIDPAKDFEGKVVLVEMWGINCGPCLASLPHMEGIWQKYKSKPFMLVGTHCQGPDLPRIKAKIDEEKLTYPIYQGGGITGDTGCKGGIPHAYLVNPRGRVVWNGNPLSKKAEMIEAIQDELSKIGRPPALYDGVKLKYFKGLKKNLELGQNISSAKSKLKAGATNRNPALAEEATAILEAIEKNKALIEEDLEALQKKDPKECAKLLKLYKKTFKDEALPFGKEI